MYLAIYTQKRENPYIVRIYLILPLVAVLVLAGLVSFIIYSGIKTSALQTEINILNLRKNEAEAQLTRAAAEISLFKDRLNNLQQHRNIPAVLGESLTLHPDSSIYAVQVSAHRSYQDAERMVQSIRGRISRWVAVQPARIATGLWFRVLVTSFDSQSEAQSYADSLVRQKIIEEYYIQRLPLVSGSADTSAATSLRD